MCGLIRFGVYARVRRERAQSVLQKPVPTDTTYEPYLVWPGKLRPLMSFERLYGFTPTVRTIIIIRGTISSGRRLGILATPGSPTNALRRAPCIRSERKKRAPGRRRPMQPAMCKLGRPWFRLHRKVPRRRRRRRVVNNRLVSIATPQPACVRALVYIRTPLTRPRPVPSPANAPYILERRPGPLRSQNSDARCRLLLFILLLYRPRVFRPTAADRRGGRKELL